MHNTHKPNPRNLTSLTAVDALTGARQPQRGTDLKRALLDTLAWNSRNELRRKRLGLG